MQQQKILRVTDAVQKTGLSRSTIYRLLEAEDFPSPIRLSKRAIGWTELQLDEWIAKRLGGLAMLDQGSKGGS